MSAAQKSRPRGGSLIDGQKSVLVRASALSKHGMALMANGTADRVRIVDYVARGHLLYIGEAVHVETGRTGEAWMLTTKGQREVSR